MGTQPQTLWGVVSKDGKIQSGSGFKVRLEDNGIFFVSFDQPFGILPAVVASQVYRRDGGGGDTRDNLVIVEIDENRVRLKTGDNEGRSEHRDFTFIAMSG
jgi:hypothetical protein